ncbi:hypothetical protein TNCT_216521 [Trichonephila clavata]|uniref:C2H2-type domain-containing protein n=1 Tax=Trichonephila clavata TaxID=2740835 RepID=A0A8X6KT90_TRICU|nr:hypothetical protein TNCT_216521 [Trichonephila clavata]
MKISEEKKEDSRNVCDEDDHPESDECQRLKENLIKYKAFIYSGRFCSICNEHFKNETAFNEHMQAIHLQTVSYPCPVCRELWPYQDELIQHLRVNHFGYFNANYQALLKKYPNSMSLKRIAPSDVLEFLDDSTPAFDNAVSEPLSLKDCSPSIASYLCPVCNELWPYQDDLIQHLRVNHFEYFNANYQALLKKYPNSMSLKRIAPSDVLEFLDDSAPAFGNAVSIPVSLKNCSPPTAIKNKETQQMPGGINSSSFSEIFTISKRSEIVRKHVSTASLDQALVISDNNLKNAPSTSFHQMPSYLPYASNIMINAGLQDASDDISLKESQRNCFTAVKKSTIIKKEFNTILPSINQLQKDPVISVPTAQLPKVIGKTLSSFQKLNTPEDIDTVVPVNRKTVNFNSECLKESHIKDSSTPNLTTPSAVLLYKLNLTPPKSELKKNIKSALNTTTIKKRKEFDAVIKSSIEEILQEEGIQDEKEQKKRENILRKLLLKWEEKEKKKLVKYFQKIVASYIKKRKVNLNKKEKKVFDTVQDKAKLLEVIRKLNCKEQSDVGQLIKYFNMKLKPRKNTPEDIDTVVPVNRKIVNFNSECLKESRIKDSSAPNLTTPSAVLLYKLNLTPPKSELKKNIKSALNTTTIKKRKEFDAVIKSSIEEILQEEGIQDEKEQKKRENILRKLLLKWEEKEEKKLVKYFQKIVASYIKKRKVNLNKKEKKVLDTVQDKAKLLEVIRKLNCKNHKTSVILRIEDLVTKTISSINQSELHVRRFLLILWILVIYYQYHFQKIQETLDSLFSMFALYVSPM